MSKSKDSGGVGSDHSHARATPAERVAFIMGEMTENRWKGYKSVREAAAKFGIRWEHISRDAAEAGRTLGKLFAGTAEQREESRGRQLARLEHWKAEALVAKGCPRCGEARPDMAAVAKLEDIEARISGNYAPTKHEVKDVTAEDNPDALIDAVLGNDELRAKVLAKLQERREEAH